jgi:acylphosphatase
MTDDDVVRVRAIVRGRVQGVFFRASTEEEAQLLGLVGWVRNLPDRSVEIAAQGPRAAVRALLAWARKGPPAAVVTELVEKEEAVEPGATGFRITR